MHAGLPCARANRRQILQVVRDPDPNSSQTGIRRTGAARRSSRLSLACRGHGLLRPDRLSGGSRGAAVRLDAVLAEQAAEAVEFTVHPLVLRDDGPDIYPGCPLLLQPQLLGAQLRLREGDQRRASFRPLLSTPPSAVWPARPATTCGRSALKRKGAQSTR